MSANQSLQRCFSIGDLRSRLHRVCSAFGVVQRLDVIAAPAEAESPAAGRTRRAMCFLRMASARQEQAVLRHLGAEASPGHFGGDVVLFVDLDDSPLLAG